MKKSIFKRAVSSAAAIALALTNVVTQVNAEVKDFDLSTLTGYTLDKNVLKVCEDWGAEVEIAEDVNVSFQLDEQYSGDDMIAIQLHYCDAGWSWHHDYFDAEYSADEIYKVTVPAGKYHMFQIVPSAAQDAVDGVEDAGSVCWQYNFKNVKATTGEEDGENPGEGETTDVELPEGYEQNGETISGEHTFAAPSWNPSSENADESFKYLNASLFTSEDDLIIVSVSSDAGAYPAGWQVALGADYDNQAKWNDYTDNNAENKLFIQAKVSDVMAAADDGIDSLDKLNGVYVKLWKAEIGHKIKYSITLAKKTDGGENPDKPDEPAVPDSIPATIKFYTQGNEAGGWDWIDNGDTSYTITSDSDAVELKWDPVAVPAAVTSADGFGAGGLQIAFSDLALAGTKLNVEITDIMLGDTAIDDIIGEYTVVNNWDNSGTEVMIPLDFLTYDAVGKNLSAKVKITTAAVKDPDEPAVPDSIPATVKFYTQGNDAGGWAWVDNGDTSYTITPDSDAIELKWEPVAVAAAVTSAEGFGAGGLQIAFSDPELTLAGTKLNVEITDIMLGDTAIDDIIGEYTVVNNYNNSGTEVQIPLDFLTYDAVGKNLSAKVKITTTAVKDPDDPDESDTPVVTAPELNDPIDIGAPVVTDPATGSEPAATEPGATIPDVTEPDVTVPDTNEPGTTTAGEPDVVPGTAIEDSGNSNVGGEGDGTDKPVATGFAIAFVPAAAAAAMAVISKKRK